MNKKHDDDTDNERKIALIEIAAKVNRARELGNDSITVTPIQWNWILSEPDTQMFRDVDNICKYRGLVVHKAIAVWHSPKDWIGS